MGRAGSHHSGTFPAGRPGRIDDNNPTRVDLDPYRAPQQGNGHNEPLSAVESFEHALTTEQRSLDDSNPLTGALWSQGSKNEVRINQRTHRVYLHVFNGNGVMVKAHYRPHAGYPPNERMLSFPEPAERIVREQRELHEFEAVGPLPLPCIERKEFLKASSPEYLSHGLLVPRLHLHGEPATLRIDHH
jgi:hypothetical protein